jgi:ergothioneine biosynthesis protein EgtB
MNSVAKPSAVDQLDGAPIARRYADVRRATLDLCKPLSPEDCQVQSMPDASPAKWHLAHTTWFFETFVLERFQRPFRPFHPDFRVLFNSYYQGVGEQYPRPQRGLVTRPSFAEVVDYRVHVDAAVKRLLETREDDVELAPLVELGLQHEQQHQELILTDVKHMLSHNPLRPAYTAAAKSQPVESRALTWRPCDGGIHWIGHQGGDFAFDNEGPRHRRILEPFEIADRLVTNAEYQAFIAAGGYQRPELWLSDGWMTIRAEGWTAPLYWERRDGVWMHFTLSGIREVNAAEPVCHVSYYEADAYARWAAARLPTEAEWETVATGVPAEGNFVESRCFHPQPAASGEFAQLYGDVWEWTASPYVPYPGYRPPAGALGEYNGKFMCNQLVLRGGSCATPATHIRATYRNFFPPSARWQFSGIRLSRCAPAA